MTDRELNLGAIVTKLQHSGAFLAVKWGPSSRILFALFRLQNELVTHTRTFSQPSHDGAAPAVEPQYETVSVVASNCCNGTAPGKVWRQPCWSLWFVCPFAEGFTHTSSDINVLLSYRPLHPDDQYTMMMKAPIFLLLCLVLLADTAIGAVSLVANLASAECEGHLENLSLTSATCDYDDYRCTYGSHVWVTGQGKRNERETLYHQYRSLSNYSLLTFLTFPIPNGPIPKSPPPPTFRAP